MTPLNFPTSKATVRVWLIDTTTLMTIRSESFIKPIQKGHELINVTDVAFLIEHEPSGRRLLFDAGCRKDYWNLPAVIQKRLGDVIPSLRVDKDVAEILQEKNTPLDSISSVIWSHYHWDHTGNISLFPPSTSIIVGPGFQSHDSLLPGYPDKPKSPVSSSDFANRTLHEITFPPSGPGIGSLAAHDLFDDGSFYILNTPGHCQGHICGLARVTPSPNATFVFMGGDICHFAGDFRPSPARPLPDPIPERVLDRHSTFPIPCPCSVFTDHHPRVTPDETLDNPDAGKRTPWYQVTDHQRAAYVDVPMARESVAKMQAFDDSEDVLVCIAHDPTLLEVLPMFNATGREDEGLNVWKEKKWKERCHWGWLNELPREGKPGRKLVVEGFWREGKEWDRQRALNEGRRENL